MRHPPDPRIHIRAIGLSGWRAIAAIVIGLTVLVAAFAFLALGFLFIVVPALVIASVAYHFLPKPKNRPLGNCEKMGQTENATIIDGTYEVSQDDAGKSGNDYK